MIKRKMMTVYCKNRNQVQKFLSQIGVDTEYVSKKGQYIIAYFNDADTKRIVNSLKRNNLVSYFEISDKELVELDLDRKTVPVVEEEEVKEASSYTGVPLDENETAEAKEEAPVDDTSDASTSVKEEAIEEDKTVFEEAEVLSDEPEEKAVEDDNSTTESNEQ